MLFPRGRGSTQNDLPHLPYGIGQPNKFERCKHMIRRAYLIHETKKVIWPFSEHKVYGYFLLNTLQRLEAV
jgi:hypothetical protein